MTTKIIEDHIRWSLNDIRKNMQELRETNHVAIKFSKDKKIDSKKRETFILIAKVCGSLLAFFSCCEKAYQLEDQENKLQFIRLIEVNKNKAIERLNELIEFIKKNNIQDADLEFWENYKKDLERI